jgi:signal transduction histidine kinase
MQRICDRILVIDTESSLGEELMLTLTEAGFSVARVSSYPEAMLSLEVLKPDMIIFNHISEESLEVCNQLRTTICLPVILLGVEDSNDLWRKALFKAEEIRAIIEAAVKKLKYILAGIHPHELDDMGLVQALQQEVDRLSLDANIACTLQVEGTAMKSVPSRDVAIYHIVQEALSNIARHADATEAEVRLYFKPESISVKVSDNGKGFNLEGARSLIPPEHLGLFDMNERAEMLGGKLTIDSRVGEGTTVLLMLPIKP